MILSALQACRQGSGRNCGRPAAGRRQLHTWAAALGVAAFVALALAGAEYARYCFGYDPFPFRPESLTDPFPGPFYMDWRGDVPDGETLHDLLAADGVVASTWDRAGIGAAPHDPLRVIQIGISIHDRVLAGSNPGFAEPLARQMRWLGEEGLSRTAEGFPVWRHPQPFPRYGLEEGWISAMIQGQAISFLLRAGHLFGDSTAIALAVEAAAAFRNADPARGAGPGLVWRGPSGEAFLEEFVTDPPSHVLNGCLLAWLGLWDHARWTGLEEDRVYCLDLLDGIELMIPRFEIGDWTRYDLWQERPTSPFYQALHAGLAEAIHGITGRPFWEDRAAAWRRAVDDPRMRTKVFLAVAWAKARSAISGHRSSQT